MSIVWRGPGTSCVGWALVCVIRLICGRWISLASAGYQLCRVPSPPKRHSCLHTRVLLWVGSNPTWHAHWKSFLPRQLLARLSLTQQPPVIPLTQQPPVIPPTQQPPVIPPTQQPPVIPPTQLLLMPPRRPRPLDTQPPPAAR